MPTTIPFPSDQFLSGFGSGSPNARPCMDWKETHESHVFKLELPGLSKEEVKLQVHENKVLHVSAERNNDDDNDNNTKWHCKERVGYGKFVREFRLPENADVDRITASMRDGVLVVNVPKDQRKKKKHKKHSVEIGGEELGAGTGTGFGRFVCCKA